MTNSRRRRPVLEDLMDAPTLDDLAELPASAELGLTSSELERYRRSRSERPPPRARGD